MKEIYLYGAGGHAKSIINILKSNDLIVSEIYDENLDINSLGNIPVVHQNIGSPLIISIGNNMLRKKIVEQFKGNVTFSTAVAKSANVSDTPIGEGTVIMHGAMVQSSATVGKHVIINTAAVVDHDCKVADYAHISANATLCGETIIGEGAFVGAAAVVIECIKVGKWAVLGAGAVVTQDIPDYAIVVGVPARIIKYNTEQ